MSDCLNLQGFERLLSSRNIVTWTQEVGSCEVDVSEIGPIHSFKLLEYFICSMNSLLGLSFAYSFDFVFVFGFWCALVYFLCFFFCSILRNNSFSGTVPKEIEELKELEVLDLGYNNFSGSFPSDLGNNLSLAILWACPLLIVAMPILCSFQAYVLTPSCDYGCSLLDNNKFLGSISPELYQLKTLSEFQVDENQLTSAALGASCISRSIPW